MKLLRRFFSLLLLLLIGLSSIGPALFSADEMKLPACCRKAGKHHCNMAGGPATHSSAGAQLNGSGKCPFYPAAAASALQAFIGITAARGCFRANFFSVPTGPVQTEARYRTAFSRTRQKRGPPASSPTLV